MRTVRSSLAGGALGVTALLAALAATVGLGGAALVAGAACALGTGGLLARACARRGRSQLGPADLVTLARAGLAGGVAALVVDALAGGGSIPALVALAAFALVLDGVDGWLARRTGTASELGARFDMEVDAFLILTLSVLVASTVAPWALAIGLARYAYVSAGFVAPWLRHPVPPRYWRKVVAAIQGIVLTVAAGEVLPRPAVLVALAIALLLLAESFGRDVVWLWRHERRPAPRTRTRTALRFASTALGALITWFALLTPNRLEDVRLSAFLRVPVEALVVVGVALLLPRRPRQAMALTVGALLGVLAVLKVLDLGFYETLDRPFNPVSDWRSLGPAVGVLRDSVGPGWAGVAVVLAVLLAAAVPVAAGVAVLRLTGAAARHRTPAARTVAALGAVWTAAAALGAPLASGSAARAVYAEGRAVDRAIADQHRFSSDLRAADPWRTAPPATLLSVLRGKDVIVAFVESYGRVAVQGSSFSPDVDRVLRAGTGRLRAAGFAARSAFLTSPTFGGVSWLAHSTLQSGLWVNSLQRYDQLVGSDRFTLSQAFKRAGWRTVGDVPSNQGDWPQGRSFYHYDRLYNATNVGYRGPRFSYATMTDQFVLSTFRRHELSRPGRRPVMAEIDLVSSHTPWTPLPRMVDWGAVGDGSVFDGMPAQGPTPARLWARADDVRASYGRSIQYTLGALVSYVQTFRDPNLVLVVLGDHQPAKIVTGSGATHDVPISIVAADPAVLARIDAWRWQDGLLPSPDAPVWTMDAFRNRFLSAFSG